MFIYLNTKGSFLCFPLRMQAVGLALEELLVTAQKQDCLTVGIYESAKLLNAWVKTIKTDFSDISENNFHPTHACAGVLQLIV